MFAIKIKLMRKIPMSQKQCDKNEMNIIMVHSVARWEENKNLILN